MAIFYKLNHRVNRRHPEFSGYYAVVASKGMVETYEVADEIQRNCSMKRSDVLAVLAELSEVLKQQIQQSHSVKLNGIGVFRPGISSKLAETATDFRAATHIKSLRLNFLPESFKQGRHRVKAVFAGAKLSAETAPELVVSSPDQAHKNSAHEGTL